MNKENLCRNHIYWLMGPTSSGKTTLAHHLLDKFRKNGNFAVHYDGDEVRDFFGPSHGFAEADRLKVVKTIVHLSNKAFDSGLNVVVSALTANQDARDYIKHNVRNLVLIYIECSIEKCSERDPKGLYNKAKRGEIKTLIGHNTVYLPPENPAIIINTERESIENTVAELMEKINGLGLL